MPPTGTLGRRGLLAATGALLVAGRASGGVPVGCGTPPCAFGPTTGWTAARAGLEAILDQSLLPFWRGVADASTGEGYALNHDLTGRWLGPANLAVVAQARMLWFFAHLRRHGRAAPEDAQRAERGYAVLTRRFVDPSYGGCFWQLRYQNYAPSKADKQLYAHAFVLFALSEHALVTGSAAAAAAAAGVFEVIDGRFRDPASRNYREFLLRDWSTPPADRKDYLGGVGGIRTHNTRIHLLEALTTHYELARSARVAGRLAEVVGLTERALVRTPVFCFPVTDGGAPVRQSYGHDLETIHLLLRARALLGQCGHPPAFYGKVVDDTLRLGEDRSLGGIFDSGPIGAGADALAKKDWAQAETLLTLAELFRLTRQSRRKSAFLRTLDWVGRWQVDWGQGSWYDTIGADLKPSGGKAGPWGGPYHTGRAVLGCLRLIDVIQNTPKGGCTPL